MRYPITIRKTGIKSMRFRGSVLVLGNGRISGIAINEPNVNREAFYLFYSSEVPMRLLFSND
jgi:hypothetical protein